VAGDVASINDEVLEENRWNFGALWSCSTLNPSPAGVCERMLEYVMHAALKNAFVLAAAAA
jgi:hypothetical protein